MQRSTTALSVDVVTRGRRRVAFDLGDVMSAVLRSAGMAIAVLAGAGRLLATA